MGCLRTARSRRADVRVPLAFAAIYLLWGATFLAIRIAVLEIPPLFTAGVRFLSAGTLLYAWMRLRGQPAPAAAEWRGIVLTALCMFVVTYGALFWAEQYVPSGLTSVIEATLPITTMVIEVFIFRQQPFSTRMLCAMLLGFGGIAWLLLGRQQQAAAALPCLVILAGGIAWSLGAVLTRSMPRPRSLPLTAGAQMMVGGAVLLALSQFAGELQSPPHLTLRAGLALAYLIVGGSLLGFTAYAWLLARMPATRVASHAYVNPVVAVALGYLVAGEQLTPRMLLASALVIASVFLILKAPAPRAPGSALAGEGARRAASKWFSVARPWPPQGEPHAARDAHRPQAEDRRIQERRARRSPQRAGVIRGAGG
jgi:drug/metabolite transporter (DMT)-like permease